MSKVLVFVTTLNLKLERLITQSSQPHDTKHNPDHQQNYSQRDHTVKEWSVPCFTFINTAVIVISTTVRVPRVSRTDDHAESPITSFLVLHADWISCCWVSRAVMVFLITLDGRACEVSRADTLLVVAAIFVSSGNTTSSTKRYQPINSER